MAGSFIAEWAERRPGHPALIDRGRPVSYRRLLDAVAAARAAYAAAGAGEGQRAAILTARIPAAWVAMLALRSLGVETIALRHPEQIGALGLSGLSFLVGDADGGAREGGPRVLPSPDLAAPGPAAAPPPLEPRAAHVLYSSGTTGSFKRLALPPAAEAEAARARTAFYGFTADTVFNATAFALWTAAGYRLPPAVWAAGGTVVFDQAEGWERRFADHGTDAAFLTAEGIEALLARRGPGAGRADRLHLLTGGGVLPLTLARRVTGELTGRLTNIYGATETARVLLFSRFTGSADDLHWLEPAEGAVLGIVDEEGRPVATGEEGLLRYRLGPADATGYIDDAEATARHFRDGWFYPGDLAVRRADGRISIRGRAADVVVFKGRKIAAAPIEDRIAAELGVAGVCVFTGLDPAGAERLVVALETAVAPERAALAAIARAFPGIPDVVFTVHPRFPRTENGMGKVRRQALRDEVFSRLRKQEAADDAGVTGPASRDNPRTRDRD